MNDMEEEIDRIEKISYMKINNHYNSQIAYTIKQGYTCIVYITRFEMKSALNELLAFLGRPAISSKCWEAISIYCRHVAPSGDHAKALFYTTINMYHELLHHTYETITYFHKC